MLCFKFTKTITLEEKLIMEKKIVEIFNTLDYMRRLFLINNLYTNKILTYICVGLYNENIFKLTNKVKDYKRYQINYKNKYIKELEDCPEREINNYIFDLLNDIDK